MIYLKETFSPQKGGESPIHHNVKLIYVPPQVMHICSHPPAAADKPGFGCSLCVEMAGISCWVQSDVFPLTGYRCRREVNLSK